MLKITSIRIPLPLEPWHCTGIQSNIPSSYLFSWSGLPQMSPEEPQSEWFHLHRDLSRKNSLSFPRFCKRQIFLLLPHPTPGPPSLVVWQGMGCGTCHVVGNYRPWYDSLSHDVFFSPLLAKGVEVEGLSHGLASGRFSALNASSNLPDGDCAESSPVRRCCGKGHGFQHRRREARPEGRWPTGKAMGMYFGPSLTWVLAPHSRPLPGQTAFKGPFMELLPLWRFLHQVLCTWRYHVTLMILEIPSFLILKHETYYSLSYYFWHFSLTLTLLRYNVLKK